MGDQDSQSSELSDYPEDDYAESSEDENPIAGAMSPLDDEDDFDLGVQKSTYKIFTKEEIKAEMGKIAEEAASVLSVSESAARTLLRQLKWDKAMLLERFCEDADNEMFACARQSDSYRSQNARKRKLRERVVQGQCEICFGEHGILRGLSCGHLFCTDCWLAYFKQKVHDGVSFITCPAMKCQASVDDDTAEKLLEGDDRTLAAYKKLEEREFVSSNSLFKWCTSDSCGRAVRVDAVGCQEVKCVCLATFCFQCYEEWHAPMQCELLKRWIKQCADDSETYNWINAYTKDCPKCSTAIEKNGGCNHMTCRSTSCHFEFCWICLKDWRSHGQQGYACNRYDETKDTEGKMNFRDARASLNRYLHYYNRYHNHQKSLKLEAKLYEKVSKKITQLQEKHGFSYVETQFLKEAVDVLNRCRRTLMFTYPFAFYLKPGSNSVKLFEDNQQDLELATEQLSEYLEQDMDKQVDGPLELKQKVQDKSRYVSTRRSILLKQCDEGYEKRDWGFDTEIFIGSNSTK